MKMRFFSLRQSCIGTIFVIRAYLKLYYIQMRGKETKEIRKMLREGKSKLDIAKHIGIIKSVTILLSELLQKPLGWLSSYIRAKKVIYHLPKNVHRVLDIGCGYKPWFFYLNPEAFQELEIIGVDIVQYSYSEKVQFKFVVADVDHSNYLPFSDNCFDLVTSLAVIEHLQDYQSFVKEVYRVLKPGGYFILTTPHISAKPILEFLAFKFRIISREAVADHKQYFDEKKIVQNLEGAGFSIVELEKFELGLNIFVKAKKQV
jgi:ubiquinone/menaquinone biosynthesis C-methylase UbiE